MPNVRKCKESKAQKAKMTKAILPGGPKSQNVTKSRAKRPKRQKWRPARPKNRKMFRDPGQLNLLCKNAILKGRPGNLWGGTQRSAPKKAKWKRCRPKMPNVRKCKESKAQKAKMTKAILPGGPKSQNVTKSRAKRPKRQKWRPARPKNRKMFRDPGQLNLLCKNAIFKGRPGNLWGGPHGQDPRSKMKEMQAQIAKM